MPGQNIVEDARYLQSIAAHVIVIILEVFPAGLQSRLMEHLTESGRH